MPQRPNRSNTYEYSDEPQQRRCRLDHQYLLMRCQGTENPGNEDADEKKDRDASVVVAKRQAENEARSKKSVVETLIGRQHLGTFGKFR